MLKDLGVIGVINARWIAGTNWWVLRLTAESNLLRHSLGLLPLQLFIFPWIMEDWGLIVLCELWIGATQECISIANYLDGQAILLRWLHFLWWAKVTHVADIIGAPVNTWLLISEPGLFFSHRAFLLQWQICCILLCSLLGRPSTLLFVQLEELRLLKIAILLW